MRLCTPLVPVNKESINLLVPVVFPKLSSERDNESEEHDKKLQHCREISFLSVSLRRSRDSKHANLAPHVVSLWQFIKQKTNLSNKKIYSKKIYLTKHQVGRSERVLYISGHFHQKRPAMLVILAGSDLSLWSTLTFPHPLVLVTITAVLDLNEWKKECLNLDEWKKER